MPIWDFMIDMDHSWGMYKIHNYLVKKIWVMDLHTHYRIWAVSDYFKKENIKDKYINILEIWCWMWNNLIEIHKIDTNISAVWYDMDLESINYWKKVIKYNNIKNIHLHNENAVNLKVSWEKAYDYILLIDFLEHIEDDKGFIKSISHLFANNPKIVVSVPTHKYKKIFWESFHKDIWHVRDWYSINQLIPLFEPYGYTLEYKKYHSWLISQIWLYLSYRVHFKIRYLEFLKKLFLLLVFKKLDFINWPSKSCSLFCVFKKKS
ncbi:MAG: hypothetical protein ACD_80C00151G0013 [uncultured bacterium (gcode 4)]|uniref:Methyltransferase type 11 n=1 Tax=uncultured bacterium (gcode 4) TaxID=1234023 RepID=K1XWK5_9BACT|nr:MAG: hypothetical protein ACD_80C00151G0013 [uncultured bacterium (gcode 4)]